MSQNLSYYYKKIVADIPNDITEKEIKTFHSDAMKKAQQMRRDDEIARKVEIREKLVKDITAGMYLVELDLNDMKYLFEADLCITELWCENLYGDNDSSKKYKVYLQCLTERKGKKYGWNRGEMCLKMAHYYTSGADGVAIGVRAKPKNRVIENYSVFHTGSNYKIILSHIIEKCPPETRAYELFEVYDDTYELNDDGEPDDGN
jgi:hypothetical protein